jgi:membrane peptidoglycan carboxypeptidase
VNHLRVQTDNLDQPFDMNKGAKLDLGSTAKLRTLITYLEVFSRLHGQLTKTPIGERRQLAADGADPLTRWAAGQLAAHPEQELRSFLEAAMARRYSASPHEFFYTGGGQHRFANFNRDDDARTMPVAQALRHSVNLVFIRMMRDIVRHYIAQPDDAAGELLRNRKNPGRSAYLARFADREGSAFLHRFHREFAGLDPDQVLRKLADRMRPRASRLAVAFRTVRPDADRPTFAAFLRDRLSGKRLPAATIERLYRNYAPEKFSLADRGYLARVHPLKLWLAGFLQTHPAASRREILTASTAERQASYIWLFRTRHKRAQDRRIRVLLEEDAFERIHEAWQRLGYPFDSMVPSYASALGSSADRPEALAELIGIILNDGVLQPTARIERLHFAADTPYETILGARPAPSKRILAPEIAQVVRAAMIDVVEAGTARRLRGAFLNDDGTAIPIGAKTGTGDNRRKYFDRRGRLIRSEVVSRTATVVFFIGDQLFGNMTIYVPGKAAAGYRFTSSLPAQLLKALAPALQPLLDGSSPQTVEVAPVSGA